MLGMSVKSVPGCFVAMAPSLIVGPVAFLPVPRPQTLFVFVCFPDPIGPAVERELAAVASTAAARTATGIASAKAALRNLIRPPPFERCPLFDESPVPSDRARFRSMTGACRDGSIFDHGRRLCKTVFRISERRVALGRKVGRGGDDDVEQERFGAVRERGHDLVQGRDQLLVCRDPS